MPEEFQQCLKEGRCFRCHEQGHVNRRCPNKNQGEHLINEEVSRGRARFPRLELEHVKQECPNKDQEDIVSLGAWRYLEKELDADTTLGVTNKQNSRVGSLAPIYSRVGSPAPKYKEQRKDAVPKMNPTNMKQQKSATIKDKEVARGGNRWERLNPEQRKRYFDKGICFQCGQQGHIGCYCLDKKPPKIRKTEQVIQSGRDDQDSSDDETPKDEQTCIDYLRQQRMDTRVALTRPKDEQERPAGPWVNSRMMTIKLTISTEENGWREAQYSYWKVYRGVPTLWGTMGVGYPTYHEPTYLIKKTWGKETHKGPPILQTVFRGELIYEQDIFNDMQMQTAEHSIRQDWKALKKDQQLHQWVANGTMAQIEELSIWELDLPFPNVPRSSAKIPLQSTEEQGWEEEVRPYQETYKIIQPGEKKHMLTHEHFCKKKNCKYHNTTWKEKQDSPGEFSSSLSWTNGTWQYRPKEGMVSWKWRFMMRQWRISAAILLLRCCWLVYNTRRCYDTDLFDYYTDTIQDPGSMKV